jgi:hypothetical protein
LRPQINKHRANCILLVPSECEYSISASRGGG